MRRQRDALRRRLLAHQTPITPPGTVTAVNDDGTVQLTIGGDPADVTAYTHRGYAPVVGDVVDVEKRGRTRIVHDAYATAADVAARTLAAQPSPITSTLVQGDTWFVDTVLWGKVPAVGTLLVGCSGTSGAMTDSVGTWTVNLGATFVTGYTMIACSAATGDCAFTSINQGFCTGSTISGHAYTATGASVMSAPVVVCYSLIGV